MQLFKVVKRSDGGEKGAALLETVIALGILGLVAVVLLSSLATVAKATYITDVRSTAESLIRSELEYIKAQSYIHYVPGHEAYLLLTPPGNYTVEIAVVPIDPVTKLPLGYEQDQGLQKFIVTVNHKAAPVLIVEDYKADK
ncbi:hypothetical protein ACFLUE_02165 [Chloroflexota bacterium]